MPRHKKKGPSGPKPPPSQTGSHAHVEFTSPPDISKFLEKVSPSKLRETEEFLAQMKADRTFATNEERRKAWRVRREHLAEQWERSDLSRMTTTQGWDTKPQSPKHGVAPRSLSSILIKDLQVGATHRGSVLQGRIVEHPMFMASSAFILEDVAGALVEVAVYNIPNNSWRFTQSMFPPGRAISIREPYFKQRGDGTLGIRVDDPDDVQEASLPVTSSEWREEGNAHFRGKHFVDALKCYEKALVVADEHGSCASKDLSVLFANRALCMLKIGDPLAALRFAGVSLHLDVDNKKADHRLQQAWVSMPKERYPEHGKDVTAAWCRCSGVFTWEELAPSQRLAGSWTDIKGEGRTAFEAGQFCKADESYANAIAAHGSVGDVSNVCDNAAAACLELKQFDRALEHSTTAVVLDRSRAKAWVRRSRALEGLNDRLAETGLDGVDHELARLEAKFLKERLLAKSKVTPLAATPTDQQRRDRDKFEQFVKGKCGQGDANAIAHFGTVYAAAPEDLKRRLCAEFGDLIGRIVPEFHTQFPKEYGWPSSEADLVDKYRQMLCSAHAAATTAPWAYEYMLKSSSFEASLGERTKRLGGSGPLEWMLKRSRGVNIGEVLGFWDEESFDRIPDSSSRISFSNRAPETVAYHLGTVHVSVGFNDLSELLACQIHAAPSDEVGPLRFLGIGMNAFTTAKSAVLVQMLMMRSVPLESCLQVWYSAAWSSETLASFQSAVRLACRGFDKEPTVQSYLSHWLSATPPSLADSRRMWADTRTVASCGGVASLKRHKDRMALVQYWLTGDLGVGPRAEAKSPAVGSLTMFAAPRGAAPLLNNESALNAVALGDLAKELSRSGADIITALVALISKRLKQLRKWLLEDALTIEIRHSELKPGSALVDEIRSLMPYTMYWSNTLDYMWPREFHALARTCSLQCETVHYGYSRNWKFQVWGASIFDYDDVDARRGVLEASHTTFIAFAALYPEIAEAVSFPPFEHPANYTETHLSVPLIGKWTTHFFKHAKREGPVQVLKADGRMHNPFEWGHGSISMAWTYDGDMNCAWAPPNRSMS